MMTQPLRPVLTGLPGPVPANSPGWAGRKVRLREVLPVDHRTLTGFDRDAVRDGTPQVGGYRHWAAHRSGAGDSGDTRQLAIETLRGGRMLVGSLCVTEADQSADVFSYGVGIGARHRRCGYAGDAIIVLLSFMFAQRRYRKCEVSIYGGNLASLSLHGGLGFREEGRLRDTELAVGGIKYLVRMGITAYEFAELHPNLTPEGASERPRRGRHSRATRGRHWNSERLR